MRVAQFGPWKNARNGNTGRKSGPTRLRLETLEARLLPSLTPHLLKDI
jgi:hypothetical protein